MPNQKRFQLLRDCVSKTHITVLVTQTIDEALHHLQQKRIDESVLYIYVVDDQYHLKGILPMRKLILSSPSSLVSSVMQSAIISMREDETLGEAIETLQDNKLLAVPVINHEGRLLGIIDIEHYLEHKIDIVVARQRINVFQMIGYHLMEKKKVGVFKKFSQRMPWIFCNMIGGIVCALISQFYSEVLSKMITLAFFIPLVLTLSESISMQSVAETLHLIEQKISKKSVLKYRLFKELKIVFLLAVSSGVLIGLVSLFFDGSYLTPSIITLSIISSIFCSAFIGTLIPVIFQRRKKDPKVSSGPLVLMIADVVSTFIYLSMGYLFIF